MRNKPQTSHTSLPAAVLASGRITTARFGSSPAPRLRRLWFVSRKRARGFLLILAILIAGVVLSVALGVANISNREIRLGASQRESQVAFAAADLAEECVLLWDIRPADGTVVFPVMGQGGSPPEQYPPPAGTVLCNGLDIMNPAVSGWAVADDTPSAGVRRFTFTLKGIASNSNPGDNTQACATVQVDKSIATDNLPTGYHLEDGDVLGTVLEVRGRNTCVTGDARLVERGLKRPYTTADTL